MTSIRARLLASIAAIQIAGAGMATYLVVQHERHQSYIVFDANLGEQAAEVRSLVEAPDDPSDAMIFHDEFLALRKGDRFLVRDGHGKRIGGSDDWLPAGPLPQEMHSVVPMRIGETEYRALILQKLPVVDTERQPAPASPTITLIYAAPVAPVETHIRHVEIQAIEACLALLAAAMLVSAWALTRGLRPLRDLASDAERIDVDRWTLPQLDASRQYSELKPLADSLAELVDRLHAAFDRERQFFGDAAHEMKSSVAIVRSTLQFALQTDRNAADYRRELQDALADTARLQALVANMLDLARIESIARVDSVRDSVETEVHAEVQRVIDRMRPLSIQKGVRLEIDADQQEAWVRMSAEDLLTVLSNLVENAIQYSDAGTHVAIAIRAANGLCQITVSDQGCGIAASALPHIFDRFYRGDASRSRATGGFGLGLSIAKALILRANGTISVQSEPGDGTSFTITLPM